MIHIPGRQDYRVVILIFAFHCGSAFESAIGGHPETCAVTPSSSDCNGNEVADDCDIGSGMSVDCNENDIPDECEVQRHCPPLGEFFTPEHIFVVRPYCGVCDSGHYGIDYVEEIARERFLRQFVQMPYEFCNELKSAAVSPDGKRLRIGRQGSVLEFSPQGDWSEVPGVSYGHGNNGLAYDQEGNFYTTRQWGSGARVFRYPAEGGPPTVLAYDDNNGIPLADAGPIGVGPNGEVYVADYQRVVRISKDGTVTLFDTYANPGSYVVIYSIAVDDSGTVFVIKGGGILRYSPETGYSRELYLSCTPQYCSMYDGDLSPDRSKLWISVADYLLSWYPIRVTIALDPVNGSHPFVMRGGSGSCGGMAVVPLRGDITDDRESDAADFSLMISCFNGVNVGPPDPACYGADMDSDWDVDLKDMQSFIRAHTVHNR